MLVSVFVAQLWQGASSLSLFSFFIKNENTKKKVACGGGVDLGTAGMERSASMAESELRVAWLASMFQFGQPELLRIVSMS